jgi:ribosomal protein S14
MLFSHIPWKGSGSEGSQPIAACADDVKQQLSAQVKKAEKEAKKPQPQTAEAVIADKIDTLAADAKAKAKANAASKSKSAPGMSMHCRCGHGHGQLSTDLLMCQGEGRELERPGDVSGVRS